MKIPIVSERTDEVRVSFRHALTSKNMVAFLDQIAGA